MRKIIFRGRVLDVNDPKFLGRVRIDPIIESSTLKFRASLTNDEQLYNKWDKDDPFVFLPLNTIFTNIIPKEGEYVNIIYSQPRNSELLDRFYIGPMFSSVLLMENEPFESAVTNLELGPNNKPAPDITRNDGTLNNPKNDGVYIKPEDIGFQGRGSSDLILKKDEVLIRAGKIIKPEKNTSIPSAFKNRAFLQMSKFDSKTNFGRPDILKKIKSTFPALKLLIEYNVGNSSSTTNSFTGSIKIYKVRENDKTNSKNFRLGGQKINLVVGDDLGSGTEITLNEVLTADEFSELVNNVIRSVVNETDLNDIKQLNEKYQTLSIEGQKRYFLDNIPIYFRPNYNQYIQYLSTTNSIIKDNLDSKIWPKIGVNSGCSKKGWDFVFDKKFGCKPETKIEKNVVIPQKTSVGQVNTTTLMGSDTIYLLSHKSNKLNGTPDSDYLTDTTYGIDEKKIANVIEPNTSSLVRGEELIVLLEKIVDFLFDHVHPFPGRAPLSVGENSTVTKEIIAGELRNASQSILNKNIRIN